MENPITIIYAEDKELFRKAVIEDLKPFNILTVGEANNGIELIGILSRKTCDVVLLDIEMPEMDGNRALGLILEKWPATRVIMVSWHFEDMLVEDYIGRGAKGYISKDNFCGKIEVLAEAIADIAAGKTIVQGVQRQKLRFSRKQKEIIPMMLQGFTNEQIAGEIGVKERAIEKQRSKIYAKFGGKSLEFLKYAFSKGLQYLKEIIPASDKS